MEKNKISILIVDDEEMIVTILINFLSEKGYAVTGINDPEEALELLKRSSFDIVFTDLMMPQINGMELVKEIRQQENDTQIIIFTGYASVDSAIDAVQQGVYDYIKKPFRLEDIDKILTHAIEKLTLKRENETLHNEVKSMLSQITMLYDISNILYQVREQKYAVEMLFDTMAESMHIHTALLCEPENDVQKFGVTYTTVGAKSMKNSLNFNANAIFNGKVLSNENITILPDVGAKLKIDDNDVDLPDACRQIIFIPIKYQGLLQGYLVIVEHKDHVYPFTDELTLLKILATQIAPIIGSRQGRSKRNLESNDVEPIRALDDLINAELGLSDISDTPVSFAMTRLIATGMSEEEADFSLLRVNWRNLIADQLGPDKRLYWAGYDTLMIMAVGGNPVGLDHHLANVRNEMESGRMRSKSKTDLSMTHAILTYPFDADSAKKITAKLSSCLFNDVRKVKYSG
ncbi:MAG: response regulator [Candidatus Marinimicrobia bacterium]|nr:response regulator [Candidatus Neomarinimicrobiota bacterium]